MRETQKTAPRPAVRVFRKSPEKFFLAGFTRIANTRMKGVPICNPKLRVSALPFKRVDGQWMGGLVTPWSLLVIRACGNPPAWERIPETQVASIALPGGDFSFMGIRDPDLGEYQSCSLLSPTWEVGDQATAEAVVRIALETMLTPSAETPAESPAEDEANGAGRDVAKDGESTSAASRPLSRRAFFSKTADALARKTEAPSGKSSPSIKSEGGRP